MDKPKTSGDIIFQEILEKNADIFFHMYENIHLDSWYSLLDFLFWEHPITLTEKDKEKMTRLVPELFKLKQKRNIDIKKFFSEIKFDHKIVSKTGEFLLSEEEIQGHPLLKNILQDADLFTFHDGKYGSRGKYYYWKYPTKEWEMLDAHVGNVVIPKNSLEEPEALERLNTYIDGIVANINKVSTYLISLAGIKDTIPGYTKVYLFLLDHLKNLSLILCNALTLISDTRNTKYNTSSIFNLDWKAKDLCIELTEWYNPDIWHVNKGALEWLVSAICERLVGYVITGEARHVRTDIIQKILVEATEHIRKFLIFYFRTSYSKKKKKWIQWYELGNINTALRQLLKKILREEREEDNIFRYIFMGYSIMDILKRIPAAPGEDLCIQLKWLAYGWIEAPYVCGAVLKMHNITWRWATYWYSHYHLKNVDSSTKKEFSDYPIWLQKIIDEVQERVKRIIWWVKDINFILDDNICSGNTLSWFCELEKTHKNNVFPLVGSVRCPKSVVLNWFSDSQLRTLMIAIPYMSIEAPRSSNMRRVFGAVEACKKKVSELSKIKI